MYFQISVNPTIHDAKLQLFLKPTLCCTHPSTSELSLILKPKIIKFWFDLTCVWLMEKAMAPHSSTLAWKIPWMEEPGRLQSMGSRWVGHDWVIHFHFSLSCIGEGNGNPLQCSCLENPMDGGAWWAAVYGVAQSRTRLKRLSNSSSKHRNRNEVLEKMLIGWMKNNYSEKIKLWSCSTFESFFPLKHTQKNKINLNL